MLPGNYDEYSGDMSSNMDEDAAANDDFAFEYVSDTSAVV
ncbi:hypothetical protein PC116_g26236 [Phytophthora cactorum]|uniref:Uncharacterized protein n=1 Tax=Phytophthora cactorum TaxID=29920 RepID=A0A329RZS3_9STRA|nr:hypothetical protein PC112_g22006 [Phytophthora cactorum]KAG2825202.1 hypothetical protein PC113_g21933 [Phytophthora cactorum]KAG2875963.1 hypothetical protein PC114_g24437 [Phytophthora cactorum]KAG2891282.1 hypothetical protein PC117_g24279 [Phytophthora cactorum]KAG2969193.1 hypothetical protein PC119_g23994 [Phytophthora cactorum]